MLGNSPFFQNNIAIKSHLKYLQIKRSLNLTTIKFLILKYIFDDNRVSAMGFKTLCSDMQSIANAGKFRFRRG